VHLNLGKMEGVMFIPEDFICFFLLNLYHNTSFKITLFFSLFILNKQQISIFTQSILLTKYCSSIAVIQCYVSVSFDKTLTLIKQWLSLSLPACRKNIWSVKNKHNIMFILSLTNKRNNKSIQIKTWLIAVI